MLEQIGAFALNLPPLLYVVVALASVWYIRSKNRLPGNIPPLPTWPIPFLGHIPMLTKDTLRTLQKWQNSTGDIYSIYMGQTLTVVMSSYQVLKEAFVKNADHFSDRPHRFVDTDPRFAGGIIDTSGPLWKEQRGVTVSILRKFGMGKNWMGEKINVEVQAYLDTLTRYEGEPINVRPLTNACVSNVVCTILTGHRFELDDPQFQRLFKILAQQAVYLQGVSVLRAFPWLKYLPGDLFHAKAMLKNEDIFRTEFSLKYINKMREADDQYVEQNFINSYQNEEKDRKESKHETTLNEQNLTMVITNLFQAGTETTSTTILWALLFAIHNPKIQEKVQQEIDEVIGTKVPSVEDKARLKYVNAFIMETQRLGSIAPLSVTIAGYTIPEGTIILPHLDAVLHDVEAWGDPMVFRPERFLNDGGDLFVPENFIPFSLGRRLCPGDALAKMELFLFITGILQRFHLRPQDPDNLPSREPVFGLASTTKPYKLKFIPRQ